MPVSHLASVTGEPSSDLRHSAYETSEPNEKKGDKRRQKHYVDIISVHVIDN